MTEKSLNSLNSNLKIASFVQKLWLSGIGNWQGFFKSVELGWSLDMVCFRQGYPVYLREAHVKQA